VTESVRISVREREEDLERRITETRVSAFREQMAAMAPELVATLKTLGHQQLALEITKHVSPLAILGGESVTDVVARLLGALPVGTATNVKNLVAPNKKNP
jgi:major vault protein